MPYPSFCLLSCCLFWCTEKNTKASLRTETSVGNKIWLCPNLQWLNNDQTSDVISRQLCSSPPPPATSPCNYNMTSVYFVYFKKLYCSNKNKAIQKAFEFGFQTVSHSECLVAASEWCIMKMERSVLLTHWKHFHPQLCPKMLHGWYTSRQHVLWVLSTCVRNQSPDQKKQLPWCCRYATYIHVGIW